MLRLGKKSNGRDVEGSEKHTAWPESMEAERGKQGQNGQNGQNGQISIENPMNPKAVIRK